MTRLMGILLPTLKLISTMAEGRTSSLSTIPKIHQSVPGLEDRTNDIIYHPPDDVNSTSIVMYFGGDVQDFSEKMLSHQYNKLHVEWNLENTASLLHSKFPSCHILIVKAAKMHLNTFACYDNFVDNNDFGAPAHTVTLDALRHLKSLVENFTSLGSQESSNSLNSDQLQTVTLIGFSKGCVVLNQLLYAFNALSLDPEKELENFMQRIHTMVWLDGAHSGSCDTWVTDRDVLKNFAQLPIKIRIHVTPYQVLCDMRPRIGKEEKIFRETLRKFGADIERTLHFEDKPKSIECHFKVLEAFSLD